MKRVTLFVLACVAMLGTAEPEVKESEAESMGTADSQYYTREGHNVRRNRPEEQRKHEELRRHEEQRRHEEVRKHEEHRKHEGLRRHEEQRRHEEHRKEHQEQYAYFHPQEHGYSEHQKIVERVHSPDYFEPTVILDYRYLKSGGRDYVRGPGGQVIILPRGVHSHEHKEFKDYDSLIEHLRIKNSNKAYRQEDVSRFNKMDTHRPKFNQIDDPHLIHEYMPQQQEHYEQLTHENQWHH